MDHLLLEHKLKMLHSCGQEFQTSAVEEKPLLLICPGCDEILVRSGSSYENGVKYLKCGNYFERKEDGLN